MEAASMVEIPTRWKYAGHFIHGSLAQLGSASGFYGVYQIISEKFSPFGIVVFLFCSMNRFPQRHPMVMGSNPI